MVETPIQKRFADIDQLGHVNNVNLQHYFDLGKTDYYYQILGDTLDWSHLGLVQKSTHTVYEAQTRMQEPVVVRTKVESVGTTSFTMYQELVNKETGELKAYSRSVLIMFDFEKQHKIPVLPTWLEAMEKHEQQQFQKK